MKITTIENTETQKFFIPTWNEEKLITDYDRLYPTFEEALKALSEALQETAEVYLTYDEDIERAEILAVKVKHYLKKQSETQTSPERKAQAFNDHMMSEGLKMLVAHSPFSQ